ncbi:MAG: hypothetical protein ACRDHL_03270 [Candidatus Promineifilaceae bacterium]
MGRRPLRDRKGETFAFLEGERLLTLDGELSGRLEGGYILDTAGNRIWRVYGDGVYSLDSMEAIGYFGAATPDD